MNDDFPSARVVRDELTDPPPTPPTPEAKLEADVAAFSRANHHRWSFVWAGAAVGALVAAIVLAVIGHLAPDVDGRQGTGRVMYVWAAGALIAATAFASHAVRVWRGSNEEPY